MKSGDTSETFYGEVKYSSSCMGSVKWRSGCIIIDKNEEHGWHIRMKYVCSKNSILNLQLSAGTLRKFVCKDNVFIDVTKGKDLISLYLKPQDKKVVKQIEELCKEVQRHKLSGSVNNSEVGITMTPAKSGLFTDVGNSPAAVKVENSPQSFTSVKSHKREAIDEEGKENLIRSYSKPSEQFLQRSSEKSRQCLGTLSSSFYGKSSAQPQFSSTPKWLSKRTPGMMPDPTPNKRARLSDSIPYTMKMKPSQPADNTNQQQTLQGFSNLGNTCYMNAILQSLFGLETFSSDLMANKKMLRSFQQQSLCCALTKLLCIKHQVGMSDSLRREALRRVKSAISTSAKRFSGYGQHDAHEFLGQVLDQLKEEVVKVSKATPTPNKENEGGAEKAETTPLSNGNNPITVNFEFEVLHTLTCLQCREEVTKTEQFHDISLDVPKQKDLLTPRSLQDALSFFFKSEEIEYTCEKCGHGKSNVSHKITRLPRIFILHLKRYSYNQIFSKNTKMGQNVSIPTYISMKNHCTEETQPAFPPTLQDSSHNSTKFNSELEDSKEDLPSRRKLEYSGFQFKSQTTSKESDVKQKEEGSQFTETKIKRDDVDSVLTLEDEDDSELSRAIEMSLKEQEEKDQMCRDYGEDSGSNFERVLELSRQEHRKDDPSTRNVNQMSEEEQLQLAIEQSLMDTDPYCHNNIHSDDVMENDDHMYSRNGDEINRNDHSYTESYDIGPDGDCYDRIVKRSHKTYGRKRHHSESDVKEKFHSGQEYIDENTKIKKILSKTTDSFSDDMSTSIEKDNSENVIGAYKNAQKNTNCFNSYNKNTISETPGKDSSRNWRNRLNNLSSCFSTSSEQGSASDDLLCTEEMPESFSPTDEKTDIKGKSPGQVFEIHNSEDFSTEEQHTSPKSGDIDEGSDQNRPLSENSKLEDAKICDRPLKCNEKDLSKGEVGKGMKRECQLTPKGGNKEAEVPTNVGVDEYVFLNDNEDDTWLSLVEDKENKIPLSEKPTLSNPEEFSMDEMEGLHDEVDAFVEEDLDIPEIKNEKGDLPYSYKLVSIVNHMGMSSATGHYLSDVYDMKKKSWYSFDDSHVSKITEAEVKSKRQRSGYIFFYMSKEIFDDLELQHSVEMTSKRTGNTAEKVG